jgi:hypothetical protein
MKVVAVFGYRHEAEFAAATLSGAGIPSFVRADDAGGLHPALGFMRRVRLVVATEDEADALELLRDAGILEGGEEDEDG